MAAQTQLRMYTIKAGKMNEWLEGWTNGVLPLRRKFGFRVHGAWIVRGEDRFVWLLTYDGPEGFEARDAAYYASEERKALRQDPAPLIEKGETVFLEPVMYD